jgi:hypothetical protein
VKLLRLGSHDRPEAPHLPAGREPGAQTLRNRERRTFLWPFVFVVGTAMYAAGVWIAAGGRGDRFDRQEELYGGLFFAALGLMCLFYAFLAWQGGKPRQHPRLRGTTLLVAGDELRRGDDVSVTLTRVGANDDRLLVGLVCNERVDVQVRAQIRTGSMLVRQTAETTVHEEWRPVTPGERERAFTFQLPAAAPYSYEGDCVSFAWRVSARAVRRWRKDPRLDEPIWVQP